MKQVVLSQTLTEFVRPSEHSTYSPSGGDRWIACPASIKLSEGIPDETSKYAEEGTLAHKVCEDLFAHLHYDAPKSAELMMADDEMLESAQAYYDCVTAWLRAEDWIGEVLWFGLEKGIPIFPSEGCFGTADAVIVGTKGCAIIDFKYGKGRAVGAKSTQLKLYLLGVMRHLMDYPEDYQFHSIVVQPRTDAIPKTHEYTLEEMKEFEPIVKEAIEVSKRNDLQPVEGNHCFWCKARRVKNPDQKCPAIKEKARAIAGENFDQFLTDMNTSVEKLGAPNEKRDKALLKIMSLLPLMQQIAKDAVEEFTYRIEEKGETIDGLRMVEKKGNSKWRLNDDEGMALEIAKLYPHIQPSKVISKLKTITEIKKEVGAKNFNDSLVVRPIKKELQVMDEKTQEVLGQLSNYGKMLGLDVK